MKTARPTRLSLPVDERRDHVLGGQRPAFTLIEYGSYACEFCHAAHEVITNLRDRFGDRMRYVYRHLPLADRETATRAAEMAATANEATRGRPGNAATADRTGFASPNVASRAATAATAGPADRAGS